LTMLLENTSPATLSGGSGYNAPGITGFGFNLDPVNAVISWELIAYSTRTSGSQIVIGSSVNTNRYLWNLGTTQAGITMDYLNRIKDVKGALYNPAATRGFAAAPNYFTQAILTMKFASVPLLDSTPDRIGSGLTGSEYVRMQNVGQRGCGSLKLIPDPPLPPTVVPEPSTLLLLGAGLSSLALWCRRRKA